MKRVHLFAWYITMLLGGTTRGQTELPHPVEWKQWKLAWQAAPSGIVLSDIRYNERSVLKFASLADVFVAYDTGAPRIIDQQEAPFGSHLIELTKGVDCLPGGKCSGFDANGQPADDHVVLMIHEEPATLTYLGNGVRDRGQTLVLWNAYALGDYAYIVQWRFGEDGSIMPQVGLTGKLAYFGGDPSNSSEVGAAQRAIAHSHNFYYWLDFDVDGQTNMVEELNSTPSGIEREGARSEWTPIRQETSRELSQRTFRSWRVVNPGSRNRLGLPRSYELIPNGSAVHRGAKGEAFAQADLWILKHYAAETPISDRFFLRNFPHNLNGESVDSEDVVLCYRLSLHHQPRTEEWPEMPIDWVGFKLMPRDFLDRSPIGLLAASGEKPESLASMGWTAAAAAAAFSLVAVVLLLRRRSGPRAIKRL